MKILFIYPNLYAQIGFNYGIAYLSALLKREGHQTFLLNLNEKLGYPLDLDRIKREVTGLEPDLIGFSVVTNQYPYALEIVKSVRSYWKAPMVCGGIHATMVPEELLSSQLFDFVCVGEGEYALLELVRALEKNENLYNIPNIWVREDGKIIPNKVRPLVDLSLLPFKDYEIFFNFQKMIDAKDGWVGLMTSRGCPFRCSYCFNHQMVEIYKNDLNLPSSRLNYLRRYPVEMIMEEIEYLLTHYKDIRMFIFDDDIFTFDKDYLREFSREYKRITSIPFVVNAHPKIFDLEIASLLKEGGCEIVKFGLESGSERIRREILNRYMKDSDIIKAFDIAHKFNLQTSAFVMLGLPYEGKEELLATIKLLSLIKPNRFRWSLFFPYQKTKAYKLSEEGRFINYEKLKQLPNFTEESCLDFGPDQNLYLRKLKRILPWYVNAHCPFSSARIYEILVEKIDEMGEDSWERVEREIISLEHSLSDLLEASGEEHYAIKYQEFMAVRIK